VLLTDAQKHHSDYLVVRHSTSGSVSIKSSSAYKRT